MAEVVVILKFMLKILSLPSLSILSLTHLSPGVLLSVADRRCLIILADLRKGVSPSCSPRSSASGVENSRVENSMRVENNMRGKNNMRVENNMREGKQDELEMSDSREEQ